MKRLLLSILLLVGAKAMDAQTYSWALGRGSSTDDMGRTTAFDAAGNVYVGGVFSGTTEFSASVGGASFTSVGGLDIFFAKYDVMGNFLWAKTFGSSTSDDYTYSIDVDAAGNLYATGIFYGTVDFDPTNPGLNVLTSPGTMADMFIVKYDASGNFQWVKQITGTSHQIGQSLALDNNGNIFISGTFIGAGDFNPDPAVSATLTAYSTGYDAFLAKYDNNGNYVWAHKFGATITNGTDNFWGVDVDQQGNVYTVGYFISTVDFNPSPGATANVVNANQEVIVAKFDNSGNYIRASKALTGTGAEFGRSIRVDNAGSYYITGYYPAATTGSAALPAPSGGLNDIFIAKYDTASTFQWVRRIGGTGQDHAWQLDVDPAGAVYVTGYYFSTTLSFYDASNTTAISGASLSNPGGTSTSNAWLAKYDASGNFLWGQQVESAGNENGFSISVNPVNGDVVATGNFSNTADFDFTAGVADRTSNGATDIYIAKYEQTPLPVKMSELAGAWNNDQARLSWTTYSEFNNKGFDVERSVDGKIFRSIGTVPAKSGPGALLYEFIDVTPAAGANYYRVRQMDFNGTFSWSNTVVLNHTEKEGSVRLYPNPVGNVLYTDIKTTADQTVTIAVLDTWGKMVSVQEHQLNGLNTIRTDVSDLAPGVYFLRIGDGKGHNLQRFVKHR